MSHHVADLTLFAHVVGRPEEELDLAQAALLVAEPFYRGLDIPYYLGVLDKLGDEARRRLAGLDPGEAGADARARRLTRLLFGEVGFVGNDADYYDPRNSFLNEVLDRRTGIPISLAVVLMEVAHRADVDARGVSFPGHFLVRLEGSGGPILIDPFRGRTLTPEELRTLHQQVTGVEGDPDPRLLQPASCRQILLRMLNNLRLIYRDRRQREPLRRVLERMEVLAPSQEEIARELAALEEPRGKPGPGRN